MFGQDDEQEQPLVERNIRDAKGNNVPTNGEIDAGLASSG